MTRVLVVWEDSYFESLAEVVRRAVQAAAPPASARFPEVLNHTARSNGGFDRYVARTWPQIRAKGLPTNAGAIDHVICVVDGDHLHDLVPGIARAPTAAAEVAAWHASAQVAWQAWLHARGDEAPAATIHGVVLRWAKESLVLAGYDQPAAGAHLDIDVQHAAIQAFLAGCAPPPLTLDEIVFTDTFRHPLDCLRQLRAARKLGPVAKNAPELDDVLRALARASIKTISARVPDLHELAALIWKLHDGGAPITTASPAARPAATPRTTRPAPRAKSPRTRRK